jgi:hypothetical protein
MEFLRIALELAEQGFHVFPLLPDSKKPAIKDFPNRATRDPEKIKDFWTDPVMELEQNFNIGISTTRFGDNGALIVVDVDNKGDKRGDDVLFDLELEGKELPRTFAQRTPTGGRHIVLFHHEPVKQGVSVLGKGLDIRSKGGYIVAAGSWINGQNYFIEEDLAIAQAPEWVVRECGKAIEKSNVPVDLSGINVEEAIKRAIFFLENEAPESVKGDGGDQKAYSVAARVKDFGVPQDRALDLMMDHWFGGSGWSAEKLAVKIENAYRYGVEAPGAAAPEAQFEAVKEPAAKEELSYLEKINKDHALVYMEGSHFIIYEGVDEKGNPKRSFLTEATFKRKFSPFTVQSKDTYAEIWLDWEKRRTYEGVCFAPEREARHNYYNLWRGFTCRPLAYEAATLPQREGFDMFVDHARKNVCNGDEALFQWLIGYFAHMVQRPFERPLTTLVLRGRRESVRTQLWTELEDFLAQVTTSSPTTAAT